MTTQEYKDQANHFANLIMDAIKQKNPTIELDAYVKSGDLRYLYIYEGRSHDAILTFQGSTYYDLFRAVQSAWHTYLAINRNYN